MRPRPSRPAHCLRIERQWSFPRHSLHAQAPCSRGTRGAADQANARSSDKADRRRPRGRQLAQGRRLTLTIPFPIYYGNYLIDLRQAYDAGMWATMEARIPPRLFRIEWRRPDACPLTSGLPDAAATCASRQEDPAVPPPAARYMSLDPIRADVMVERLKMPAQPHRLTIGLTSLNGARAVGEIEAVAGIGHPAPCRQRVELHRAYLVRPRQEARRIFYKMGSG